MKTTFGTLVTLLAASSTGSFEAMASQNGSLPIARCSTADEVGTQIFQLDAVVNKNQHVTEIKARQLDGSGHGIIFSGTLVKVTKELEARVLLIENIKLDPATLPADRESAPTRLQIRLISSDPYSVYLEGDKDYERFNPQCEEFSNTSIFNGIPRDSLLTGDEQAEVLQTLVSANDAEIVNRDEVVAKLGYDVTLSKVLAREVSSTAIAAHNRLLHVLERKAVASCNSPYTSNGSESERVCRVAFVTKSRGGNTVRLDTVTFQFVEKRTSGEEPVVKNGRVRVLLESR